MRVSMVVLLLAVMAACSNPAENEDVSAGLADSASNSGGPPSNRTDSTLSTGADTLVYAENESYTILIQKTTGGDYVYKAWEQPKRVTVAPSLMLTKGEMIKRDNPNGHGTRYIFRNKEYRYELDKRYMPNTMQGSGIFLEVYKNDIKVMDEKMREVVE